MQVVGNVVRYTTKLLGGSMLPWETSDSSLLVTARYDDDDDDIDDFEEDEEMDEENEDEEYDEDEEYEDYDDYNEGGDDGEPRHGRRRNEWD